MSFKHKKIRRQEDHGVDDWLMTYADMITLILCFFAIFLSMSVPKKDAFQQARSKVIEKFASDDPAGQTSTTQGNATSAPEIPRDLPASVDPRTGFPIVIGNTEEDEGKKPVIKPVGDRLSSIDINSASFFKAGSATLSDEGKKVLDGVLETVQSDKFKDYQITIEGHTDDIPINTLQFPSNWELSTGRASAVARYFLEHSVNAQRLRASGYADTFPKVPNRDATGNPLPENQAQNRRVVIKLEKVEKEK